MWKEKIRMRLEPKSDPVASSSSLSRVVGRPEPLAKSPRKDADTRRKFLRAITTSVGGAGLLLGACSTGRADKPKGSKKSFTLPFQSNPTWLQDNFVEIANDEAAHVEILQAL